MGQIRAESPDSAPNWFAAYLDRKFKISSRGSSLRTEMLAALTTFATMSYVLAVHPMVMADAGMDRAAVITLTAVVAGAFSILMGLMANLPIVQAPGMGANAIFSYTIIIGMGVPLEAALGLVFWSGVIFLLLTVTGVRRMLLDAFPDDLKFALTAGIGLFLMFIGLKGAGIIVGATAPALISLGNLSQPAVLLPLLGVPLVMGLMARRVPGAILLVIVLITLVGLLVPAAGGEGNVTRVPEAFVSAPVSFSQYVMILDIGYLWSNFPSAFPVLLTLVFLDLFSSLAAMNAMCQRAGLVDEHGNMLKPTAALSADAIATIGSAMAGTSTTNCYGESAAGIESGGRTGLVAILVGLLFFLALFINPLLLVIPVQATAPALVFIGLLMFSEVRHINFDNIVTGGSAIITLILMGVTSISDGMALGMIAFTAAMALTGHVRQIKPLSWVLSACFVAYFALGA
ncbi:NCS2 family permease [Haliea sp. E17]|uniref:NCS2 family permease n=1 Tax=Haliea sp. E17 TaxID=3401576 RepID=UPI003AAA3F38